MTLQQCRYILQTAKAGSLCEAAKELFVAQSTLSESVKALEAELGITIFARSSNGVYLTEDGAEFVRYAERIVRECDFVSDRYRADGGRSRLYVATQHYDFIADIFGRMIREEKAKHYAFSLREMQTYDVIREVESACCDIGILAIKDEDDGIMKRYLSGKGLTFTPLLTAKPHVYVRRTHPLAEKRRITERMLREYPYVSYDQGEHTNSFFEEEIRPVNCPKRIGISDRATLMNVLLRTDCYTVGTGIMPSALNGGKIVSIPFASDRFYTIGYILHGERRPAVLAERFVRVITEELKGIAEVKRELGKN